jgi:nitrogen regulatory protein P-II 2
MDMAPHDEEGATTHRGSVVCVTIVAEAILEGRLVDDLQTAGARGWTITSAHGEGPRGRRVSDIEGGNVRVETLVSEDVAERIWNRLAEAYFPNYAITAWTHEVQVARPDRYRGSGAAGETAR